MGTISLSLSAIDVSCKIKIISNVWIFKQRNQKLIFYILIRLHGINDMLNMINVHIIYLKNCVITNLEIAYMMLWINFKYNFQKNSAIC